MATCPKCNAEVADDMKFCPSCGAPIQADAQPAEKESFSEKVAEAAEGVKASASALAGDIKAKVAEAKAAAENQDKNFDSEDIEKNKFFAILSYIGVLVLVPLLAAKDSKFAKYHANQGLILFICSIACYILSYLPVIKHFVWILNVAILILAIMGIVYAAKGEAKELPIVGKFRIIQ